MLAMSVMDPTVKGIFFLIAVVCFVLSGVALVRSERVSLVAVGLAFFAFPFMWDAFAVS
jgi:hypothetical protein